MDGSAVTDILSFIAAITIRCILHAVVCFGLLVFMQGTHAHSLTFGQF